MPAAAQRIASATSGALAARLARAACRCFVGRGVLIGRFVRRRGVFRHAGRLVAGRGRFACRLLVGFARGAHAGLGRAGRGGRSGRRHAGEAFGIGGYRLPEGLDRGQRAALDLHALDRAVQHAQVDVEPLLDGLEVGNALVEFIDVHGRCEAAGQVEAGPGLFHQVDRIEHIAQRPQSERTHAESVCHDCVPHQ